MPFKYAFKYLHSIVVSHALTVAGVFVTTVSLIPSLSHFCMWQADKATVGEGDMGTNVVWMYPQVCVGAVCSWVRSRTVAKQVVATCQTWQC